MKTFILMSIAVLLVPSVGAPQDCIDYGEYNYQMSLMDIPGAWDVEVSGSYAYITSIYFGEPNSGLYVVSIKDPQSPLIVGSVAWEGDVYKLTVSGSFAYVADGEYGLKVINVVDPGNPHIAAEYDTPGDARSVTVVGDLVLVADGDNGLLTYNFASPSQYPTVGHVDTPGMAVDVAVAGSVAYVADSDSGLQVVDISVPESPQIVGVVDTIGSISCVRVVDAYAYVAGADMHVLDISDPEAPNPVGSIGLSAQANDLAHSGAFVFIVGGQSGNSRAVMIDISDVSNPELVASLGDIFGTGSYGVAASGTHAFYSYYSPGNVLSFDFTFLDITAPIGFLSRGFNSVFDLVVSDSYAYVGAETGIFNVIDISDPASPYSTGSTYLNYGQRLAVLGDYVYSTNIILPGYFGGLNIIDVSDPTSPIIIDTIFDSSLYDVDVSGSYAYLVGDEFYVVDITNPASPQVVWHDYTIFGTAIDVSEPYAFVGGWYGGLQVVDISEPTNPYIVGTVATPEPPSDVTVAGPYAYIASDGLQVIDISDVENPQVVGSIDVPAERVAIDGSYAYVTGGIGLAVIDISNPENPQYVGEILNAPTVVGVSEGLVYCIGSDFSIYPVQCEVGVANVDGTVLGDDLPPIGPRFAVYPNPFNPQVTVEYSIPQNEWADISVYDLTGRRVNTLASRIFTAGPHTLTWNGCDAQGRAMPSGTYIIRFEAESGVKTKKVMLLR